MNKSFLSAGAVPVKYIGGEWQFLLLRSFKYWDFPKGMVESGEDPWHAALREVNEETGLKDFTSSWGEVFKETLPYGKGKIARYYLIEIKGDSDVVLLPNPITGIVEHHEWRWVPYSKAKLLLVPRVIEVLDWAKQVIGDQIHHS